MRLLIATVLIALIEVAIVPNDAAAQARYQSSISLSGGSYAASGFGTNGYVGAAYNYLFGGGKYFVEGGLGFGSLKSDVLEQVSKSQIFDNDRLFTYEFLVGIDANPGGPLPYFVAGVAGVNQGGQSRFAGVIGLGKRKPIPGFLGSNQIGFRFDVHDQIYSQTINNGSPFVTHNILATLGLNLFF
jgi:hypothetical protein